ncbi:MAG TPA: CopG family transcriptional regulator [Acidimicrobiales bacterium]|nr:CopG family transcriptional regulator [Acidimicrobiales bacterium]
MPATRTQVYLSEELRNRIDELAAAEGLTMAEVIRRALDVYLDDRPDPRTALERTFGSQPDASVPSREEWDRG